MLEVRNINFSYGNRRILKDITFEVPQGRIVSILGENGSGKSTLLRVIAGLHNADSGEVFFNGSKVLGPAHKLVPGHDKIKMVFQDFRLAFRQTVEENLYALMPPIENEQKEIRTGRLLEQFSLTHLASRKVEEISGGEKQKLSIARAMALEPAVVLMDEPFSNLDTFIKDDVEKVAFRALKDLGVTVIQITHDPVDALRYSDEIIVLRDAEVIEQKAPEELYRNPSSAYTASLTGPVNILSAEQQRSLQLPPERWFIRPEQIEINQNGIPATVNEVNFCGAFFYTELKLNEDFMLIAHLRNKLRKGEMVSIAVRIEGHL